MSNSAVLYQILFQNDTLFQLHEVVPGTMVTEEIALAPQPAPAVILPVNEVASSVKVVAEPEVAPEPKPVFPPLNHKVLILTDDSKNKMLADSEALLLDNILKAVGHSSANSDILNFSFIPGADGRQVLSEKRTNYFITFGVPLIKLHLDLLLVPYAPKMVEGIWFLLADPLAVIDADKALKKKLWLALQKMFEKA